MKKHGSVKITREWLDETMSACQTGLGSVAPFLPARLYTDVEKNIPLALELADSAWAVNGHHDYVFWLGVRLARGADDMLPNTKILAGTELRNGNYATQYDAFIIAQWLAWIADALLTRKGK